jgi:hypothetical protein
MGNVKLQQGGVYIITTQGGSSTSPRSLTGTEEIFEKTFLEGINNFGSMKIGATRFISGSGTKYVTSIDTNLFIDTTSGTITLQLPNTNNSSGQIFNIKKIGGTNTLTLDPIGSTIKIDGALTKTTTDASASIQLISSGDITNGYYILSTYGTWT